MGYKPSVFKQTEFDCSSLGNIFNERLNKDDQKEGLFTRLENIKGKNEELLKAFSTANRVSKAAKNESDLIKTLSTLFTEAWENLREWYQ